MGPFEVRPGCGHMVGDKVGYAVVRRAGSKFGFTLDVGLRSSAFGWNARSDGGKWNGKRDVWLGVRAMNGE